MESEEAPPDPITAAAHNVSEGNYDQRDDGNKAHENEEDNPSESLAERFSRLCAEIPITSPSSTGKPSLPGLPPEHARYLSRNPDGELYMTAEAVSDAEGPNRSAVISAFRAALAHAYGDDDVEGTKPGSIFPDSHSDATEHAAGTPSVGSDIRPSFCAMGGQPEFEPPDIQGFTWDNSLSKQTMDQFVSGWRAARESQERLDAEEAAVAMARAAAAGAGRSRANPRPSSSPPPRRYSFNPDSVVWAAQEEAAAAAVLRELRSNLGKLRKGSSKAPHESSAIWTLVKDGKGKLKPQAAAEMARAKVAAAAAAAAMREVDPVSPTAENSNCSDQSNPVVMPKNHTELLYEQWRSERRSNSHKFGSVPDNDVCSNSPGFPRALSLDSSTRLKNVGKKKRVEFAAGTVFSTK